MAGGGSGKGWKPILVAGFVSASSVVLWLFAPEREVVVALGTPAITAIALVLYAKFGKAIERWLGGFEE